MHKFTPGPIMVMGRVKDCSIGNFYAIGPNKDNPLCPTAYVAYREDAVLYAAAPDMLAALKAAQALLDVATVGEQLECQQSEALIDLKLAIAKAEGRHA